MADDPGEADYMADLSLFVPGFAKSDLATNKPPLQELTSLSGKDDGLKTSRQKRAARKIQVTAVEEDLRNSGLKTAIPVDNIGFKLLQKLGYKAGEGIGKSSVADINPVTVQLKRGKGGLGSDEQQKEKRQRKEQQEKIRQEINRSLVEEAEKEFQVSRKGKWESRKLRRDISKARSVLFQLEGEILAASSSKVEGNVLNLDRELFEDEVLRESQELLARRIKKNSYDVQGEELSKKEPENEEEIEEVPTMEILEDLLSKLRSEHFYCIYCGCKYSSAQDMRDNCPGTDEDSH